MRASLCFGLLGSLLFAGALVDVVACSSSSALVVSDGGAGTEPTSSGCPCTIGNSGIHVTIGCGATQCIELNGQALGYRCETSGTVEDDSVCSGDAGGGTSNPAEPVDAAPCTPRSCAELDLCGSATDDCNLPVSCPACSSGLYCTSDNHCRTPASAVVVYGNYQGGSFAIDVDQHIPGLAIGLASYDAMQVTIGGAYASDVVAVVHAGYSSGSTVAGLGANATFVDQHAPEDRPDGGFDDMILMDIPPSDGQPWPSGASITTYFQTYFDAPSVAFHECQYDAYTGTLLVSAGGSCM